MQKLNDVSTRQLLTTLAQRGARSRDSDSRHLEADAEHLLTCLSAEVLDYPYAHLTQKEND